MTSRQLIERMREDAEKLAGANPDKPSLFLIKRGISSFAEELAEQEQGRKDRRV